MKSFLKRNVYFSLFALIAIIGSSALETANIVYDLFPDKSGAGFYFAGSVFVLFIVAFIYERYIQKKK